MGIIFCRPHNKRISCGAQFHTKCTVDSRWERVTDFCYCYWDRYWFLLDVGVFEFSSQFFCRSIRLCCQIQTAPFRHLPQRFIRQTHTVWRLNDSNRTLCWSKDDNTHTHTRKASRSRQSTDEEKVEMEICILRTEYPVASHSRMEMICMHRNYKKKSKFKPIFRQTNDGKTENDGFVCVCADNKVSS